LGDRWLLALLLYQYFFRRKRRGDGIRYASMMKVHGSSQRPIEGWYGLSISDFWLASWCLSLLLNNYLLVVILGLSTYYLGLVFNIVVGLAWFIRFRFKWAFYVLLELMAWALGYEI